MTNINPYSAKMQALRRAFALIPALALALLAWAGFADAQTIRVADNTGRAPQGNHVYTTLQEALDDSDPDDVIHLVPSATEYGFVIIHTKVNILGLGLSVSRSEGARWSQLSGVVLEAGSDGTTFSGLLIGGTISARNIKDVTVERCWSSSNTPFELMDADNWIIKNNIFWYEGGVGGNIHGSNLNFTNNIWRKEASEGLTITSTGNLLVKNNVFIAEPNSSGKFNKLVDVLFINNIFYGWQPTSKFTSFSSGDIFTNNLTYLTENSDLPPDGERNSGANNLIGQNPRFEDFPATLAGKHPGRTQIPAEFDFRLKDTSPGKNYGIDGSDIGVYGGDFPFPDQSILSITNFPFISEINTSGVVLEGGDITVTVKAKGN